MIVPKFFMYINTGNMHMIVKKTKQFSDQIGFYGQKVPIHMSPLNFFPIFVSFSIS